MFKALLVCTLLIASSMAMPGWASAINDENWTEINSGDWSTGKKNATGTVVFFGMQGCGRTAYWAPKIKAWVAKEKSSGSAAGKLTYKFMGCKTGNNMNTCWREGVRQLPAVGVYDANGKQTNFYMNSAGMTKFQRDNKAGAANPPVAQANKAATKAAVAAGKKDAPSKASVAPKSAFAKLVINARTRAVGVVTPLTKKTLDAFTKSHDEAVIFFGSASEQYSQSYGPYWARAMAQLKDKPRVSKMGLGVIDCDDYSSTCFSEGVWAMPTLALYRKDKIVQTWSARTFRAFLSEVNSGAKPESYPKVNANRRHTLQNFFKQQNAPASIMYLTRDNWFEVASQPKFTDGDVHIFYGSAGCGWTRHWAPKFLSHIASRVANSIDPKTDYAVVDCNDDMPLCWKAGVRKYPHVTVWSKGKSVAAFGGDPGMKSYLTQYPTNKNNSDAAKGVSNGASPAEEDKANAADKWLDTASGYVLYSNGQNAGTSRQIKMIMRSKGKEVRVVDCDKESGVCGAQAVMRFLPTMVLYKGGDKMNTYVGLPGVVGALRAMRRRRLLSTLG